MPPRNILILGATGFVGLAVVECLVKRAGGGGGGRLRVPARRPMRARHLQLLPTVEVVPTGLDDDASLARLLRGIDAVVNLVGILHGSEAEFERLHATLPKRLAAACTAAGVRRVVHVSALGAAPDAPSRYLRSKARGEAALQSADLDLTLLRPSVMFGERDQFLNTFVALQRMAPVVPLPGADARFQPVWVEDVARAVATALDDPGSIGLVIECCGPTVYTLGELVRLSGRWSGRERPVLAVPAPLARLQAGLLSLKPGRKLMSPDNLDSMRVANVASGTHPGLERLGIEPAALESVVPRYLDGAGGELRYETWRSRARRT